MLFLMSWRMWPISVSWKIEDWSFDRQSIKALTVDENSGPWFIVEKSFQDRQYELRHLANDGVVSWDLPPITFEEAQFASISIDADSNPWLILGKRIAHWDGSQWEISNMPLDAEINDYICPSVVVKDSTVWGIDSAAEQTRIIQLDIRNDPAKAKAVLLPSDLDSNQFDFDCIIPTKTGILAALSSKERVDFYNFHNEEWERITSFGKDQVSKLFINDMTLDSAGQIWVLFKLWNEEKQVGKYDPTTGEWTWFDIEWQAELYNRRFDYSHIVVDNFGRVWISATQYKTTGNSLSSSNYEADTLGVFEERDKVLIEILHYTSKNSSLETSRVSRILQGSDGKIWTWDKQLVWLDGNRESLPNHLPNWLTKLSSPDGFTGLIILSFTLLVLMLALQIKNRSRKTF